MPLSPDAIPIRQQVTAVAASVLLAVVIIDLVRRRRLREEYAWLWLTISGCVLVFSLNLRWLIGLAHLLGATVTASAVWFMGLLLLALLNLHFSVKNSELSARQTKLAQQVALLQVEIGKRPGQ